MFRTFKKTLITQEGAVIFVEITSPPMNLLGPALIRDLVSHYNADLAKRYGSINRALPAKELDTFVRSLAHRIAKFPPTGRAVVKDRVNAIRLPPVEDIRRD